MCTLMRDPILLRPNLGHLAEKIMQLKTEVTSGNALVVCMLSDNLDSGNSIEFQESMLSLMGAGNQVVLDIAPLKFLDSTGLHVVVPFLRLTNSRCGDFRLCSMSFGVLVLFELMRLNRIFHIFGTCDEAVGAFA
jgi:anti-sigma B factor antagonist